MDYYTIGMAGHIDHGKTTLTKALTGVDTDRLKEEKKRNISIELGYAPFRIGELETSIVDVPGHERFIRQMMAGVAGIDIVVLVIAANEGVMPQTKEHLEILSFLGVVHGVIAVTKVDQVDPDFLVLVEEDIRSAVKDTVFEHSDIVFVDSLKGTGLERLKLILGQRLGSIRQRSSLSPFRLPIDQVFTIQGQGVIVRGTVCEGMIREDESLKLLPRNIEVKARQLQIHNEARESAVAGQRVAINLSGTTKGDVSRGDVLVSSTSFPITSCIDLSLSSVKEMDIPLKQRAPVKFHIGTAEVMGKIVFFDRNELNQGEQVLCQVRLDQPVVCKRGDRFVIRRPTPVETVGGGWVIDPLAETYRFGVKTIDRLEHIKEGTPLERIKDILNSQKCLHQKDMTKATSLSSTLLNEMIPEWIDSGEIIEIIGGLYTTAQVYQKALGLMKQKLNHYHQTFPMRAGMNKAECIQVFIPFFPKKAAEAVIDQETEQGMLAKNKQFVSLQTFTPHLPKPWRKRMEQTILWMKQDGLAVQAWDEYGAAAKLPKSECDELRHYLIENEEAFQLDDKRLIHQFTMNTQVNALRLGTIGQGFNIQDARDVLHITRKNLVMFLELLDRQGITYRQDNRRNWTDS